MGEEKKYLLTKESKVPFSKATFDPFKDQAFPQKTLLSPKGLHGALIQWSSPGSFQGYLMDNPLPATPKGSPKSPA